MTQRFERLERRLALLLSVLAGCLVLFAPPLMAHSVTQHVAPASATGASATSGQETLPALPPEQAHALLAAMTALPFVEWEDTELAVHSSVLCYCLEKGPQTIRALRRVAADWFSKGVAAFAARRYEEAITAFSKAVQAHPRAARAYTNRALAQAKLGQYQQAMQDLTQAMDLDPQQGEASYAHRLIAVLASSGS